MNGDGSNIPHKKRRHEGSHSSKYHPYSRYKGSLHEDGRSWRQSETSRDDIRHNLRQSNLRGNFKEAAKSLDIQIHLIGCKMKDPVFHVCEKCLLPIRSYGRMIPCKHVFCFACAKKTDNNCPRCREAVQRIEQCPLGTVFLCSINNACKRTYLSQRDLQAHINHRHNKSPAPPIIPPTIVLPPVSVVAPPPPISVPPPPLIQPTLSAPYMLVSATRSATTSTIPTVVPPTSVDAPHRPSSNLITIQIQDSSEPSFPPPPPPGRPANQPQLYPSQPTSLHYQ